MSKRAEPSSADPFAAADGPKMESGFAPLSRFKPHPDNPRFHPPEEIELLAQILRMRGPDQPIVVDEEWWILKGHGRLESAKLAKMKGFPYVQRFGLSAEEKLAIRIEDNQLALLAGWDMVKLRADAGALKLSGYDMQLLGFGDQMTSWLTTGTMVEDAAGEWAGMPAFSNPDARAFRSIVVHFNNQEDVDAFAKVTQQVISDKTRFLWYPKIIIKPFVKYAGGGKEKAAPAKRPRKAARK